MASAGTDSFGVVLKQLRVAAGLTQEALAERAGVSAKAISELERDPTRSPRLSTLALIADALQLEAEARTRLVAAARPASSGAPHQVVEGDRGELPQPLTRLFGRDGVIDAIAELVRRGAHLEGDRLLTLTGPGGVGKTRLAIASAQSALVHFADGGVFVDLAPLRDPRLVLDSMARALAIDERDKNPLPEQLAAALRRKHLLLLVDNFEHVLPARDALLELVETCPRLVVLTTSRVALRVRGEREYRIAPLELPEVTAAPELLERSPAVALFLDRALATGADLSLTAATAPAVADICRRLDGLPLAIELAAAWTRLLPPPVLLARLEPRLPLLIGGPHDLPARQRTMRDTVAWSYELLNEDEQRLFRRLCVFAGSWTTAAAAAVGGVDEADVLPRLVNLLDRTLLQSEMGLAEPRLTILATLREFGMEQLAESGEAETIRYRHANYYLALAERAASELNSPKTASWSDCLEREHDNLRAALSWLLTQRDSETALQLAGALWRFWSERGHLSEGRQWLREALTLPAGDAAGTPARVKALVGAAQLAIGQGAFDAAQSDCIEAIALTRADQPSAALVQALNTHGRLLWERGEYSAARQSLAEALTLGRSLDDQPGVAAALQGLGYVSTWAGDITQGAIYFTQSLAAFRATGDVRGLADGLIGSAVATIHNGGLAQAEAAAREALALFRDLGDTGRTADALWALGIAALFQGQPERAVPFHEENLALRRERGDEHGAIQPLSALAMIEHLRGHPRRARTLVEETFAIMERFDDPWSRAMSLTTLGHITLAEGDPATATAHFTAAATRFQAIDNLLYFPWCLEGMAGVAATRSNWQFAAQLCGTRDAIRSHLGIEIPPFDPAVYTRTVATCQSHLGDDAYATAYNAGSALPLQSIWQLETDN